MPANNYENSELNLCYGCMHKLEEGQTICPFCGNENTVRTNGDDELPEGTVLDGHFLLGKVLGRGGFGITYLGYDINLQKKVAIKEFFPRGFCIRASQTYNVKSTAADDDSTIFSNGVDAFLKEARTLARFSSPYIVHVTHYFREHGTAYIVMDYADGKTLKAEMKDNGGRLPTERVLKLMKPLMKELSLLHEQKVIHRDIKPDNLMLVHDREGEHLLLLDFGSARTVISHNTGDLTGVVSYGFSPVEQYSRRSQQGPYTDVYALCATIYNAITGTVPPASIERNVDKLPVPSFSEYGIKIPEETEKAIMHGLSVKSEDRTQTMKQLIQEIYGNDIDPREEFYQNAIELAEEARKGKTTRVKINFYQSAISVLQKIQGYSDSSEKIEVYEKEIQRLQRSIRLKRITVLIAGVVCVIGVILGIRAWNSRQQTIPFADGTYVGQLKKNLKNGQGTMTYSNGNIYEGEWIDDKKNGHGIMTYSNGAVYEGEWVDDKKNGQGIITWSESGSVYKGAWTDDKKNGQGVMIYSNGNIYEGEWENDMRNGQGIYTWAESGDVYEGEWIDDKKNGQGIYTWSENGAVYEGEWVNGERNGQGKMKYANGSVQEGIWENDEFKPELTASKWYNMGVDCWGGSNEQQQSYAEALKWFKKAGELGNADAMYWAGILYRGTTDGQPYEGVTQDKAKAQEWFEKAAAAGNTDAKAALDTLNTEKKNE